LSQRQNNQRPLGRKTETMTNIILKIEKANDKNNAFLKKNSVEVMAQANAIYSPKNGENKMGNDEYRDWLFSNHKELATYLYDELGTPNKKTGERKPIMSQHKKNIFAGIKTIATDNEAFLNWSQSDIGNEVSSLAKVTASINKYAKSLEPKTETQNASDESESTEIESTENAKPPLEQVAQELLKRFTPDECIKLSEMLYDMACENASDESIEKVA